MLNDSKQKFLLNEVWMLTINAAFQRARVYKQACLESDKGNFKRSLKQFISDLSVDYQSALVTDDKHFSNIRSIITFSEAYAPLLNNGCLNFGVSQKLFNLYLKYLWCLGIITIEPPHFPVDRVIQTRLKISAPTSWTKMVDESEYLEIIRTAQALLPDSGFTNIAELELHLFSRRAN